MTAHRKDIYERLMAIIPGGSSTSAKSPNRLCPPHVPAFAVEAKGGSFTDSNGRAWIDCSMGLGGVVWGHSHAAINEAVIRQINSGVLYSTPHQLEGDVAEMILNRMEGYQSIRFFKTGADAVSAAVRIARETTGLPRVASGTYHGWHDWSACAHYGKAKQIGVPEQVADLTIKFDENDVESVIKAASDESCAALVLCPEHFTKQSLQMLRELCSGKVCLLIFDEVKSGMRSSRQGYGGRIGITPDILCLGKGLANGYPLAATLGSEEIMQSCVTSRITSTYATDCTALAAAHASEILLTPNAAWPPWEAEYDRICRVLEASIANSGNEDIVLGGYVGNLELTSRDQYSSSRFQEHLIGTLADEGIFSIGSIVFCAAHERDQLRRIENALVKTINTWSTLP